MPQYKYLASYFNNDNKFINLQTCIVECRSASYIEKTNIIIKTIHGDEIFLVEYNYMLPPSMYKIKYL